jgi:hypothetical protein
VLPDNVLARTVPTSRPARVNPLVHVVKSAPAPQASALAPTAQTRSQPARKPLV